MQTQAAAEPERLYHYTNQTGLLGILESGELWATKVQYMNDSTEFQLALTIAEEQLKARMLGADESIVQLLMWCLNHLRNIAQVNICAVSFCKNPDLLSQWRGYSGNEVGFSIGFEAKVLSAFAKTKSCRIGPCIYNQGDRVKIINELIDGLLGAGQGANVSNYDHLPVAAAFERALIECGAFFKDSAFFEEDEWRLVTPVVTYRDGLFRFRSGKSMLVPYYVLDVSEGSWRDKILEVVVGPAPHPEPSAVAVAGLLIKNGVTSDGLIRNQQAVRPSHIPYRSW
jgi:hypothetical protein